MLNGPGTWDFPIVQSHLMEQLLFCKRYTQCFFFGPLDASKMDHTNKAKRYKCFLSV